MAQTLAVYHYGYYTLKDRTVQFHEPKHVPSNAEAVLEWGLNTPFNSQDNSSLFPLAKRKSGWEICGSSFLVWLFFVCCLIDLLILKTFLSLYSVLTAYSHVSTEPQCDIGHTRGKKTV